MPKFIVGGCVSVKEWSRRDPDQQYYVSQFAKDIVRKQEEEALVYKSEFVKEIVGSLAHKKEQVCDHEIDKVNEHHFEDEFMYNDKARKDDNLKVTTLI